MNNIKMGKSLFSKIEHVGVIVRDLDKAVEYYQSLGIGPFAPLKNLEFLERKMWGKPVNISDIKLRVSVAQMGPVNLELVQPVEGESLWKESLESRGEGINHLGFSVDDIDKEEAKLIEKGLTVIYRSRYLNGGGATYFDTGKVGGVLLELVQWPPEWLAQGSIVNTAV